MNTSNKLKINKKALYAGFVTLALALFTSIPVWAQDTAAAEAPKSDMEVLIANPLFLTLSFTIIALLLIIYSLKNVMTNLVVFKSNEIKAERSKKALAIVGFLLLTQFSFAQEAAAPVQDAGIGGLPSSVVYWMMFIISAELIVIIALIGAIKIIIKAATPEVEEEVTPEVNVLDSFNASVAIEDEASILMDHDYDGIKELDNNLPPWWKYGFYLTIVFSFIYLTYYHLGGGGKLSEAEYNEQITEAKLQVEEYRKKAGNMVDETSAKMLTGNDITAGKEVYDMNCSACHGKAGEGTVGPNLTDDYWLHGGGIKDVFKTIKYGYPEKGMKSWESDLTPMQINQVASYIKSLRGTNPANAKEKQGDLYSEEGVAATNDSTATTTDSTAVVKKDSTATVNK